MPTIHRRSLLKFLGTSAAGSALPSVFANTKPGFPIGACDWSIGKKQDIAAFDIAKQIGLEGLQVSFSTPGSAFDLRDQKVREHYYRRVEETGIKIASLGMGILNQMPLSTHPDAISWVDASIDVMAAMRKEQPDATKGMAPDICLLAFFGEGDINGKTDLMDAVITKLKTVATKAEDNGVVFGIESLLSADDHLKIIDAVGSPAIQVYYDSANSNRMGYDIYREIEQIGGDRICQVHCKEDGALLGDGVIDFPRFQKSLARAGYRDWLIIEGAMPKKADVVVAYQKNFQTLDKIFRG